MKKILVITYYWPPSGGSGVQRWVKFAKYLPSEGWQPVIYTPLDPDLTAVDKTLAAEVPASVEVIRRPILEPYSLYRRFLGKSDATETAPSATAVSNGPVTPISSGKKSLKERIALWVRGNLFVPDPKILWVGPSVRYLKKYLKEHPVDVIVTTGPPHSLHLIGRKLHKKTGIPWIPDFRDPWSRMYYLKHLGMTDATWRKLRKQEKSVLDEASEVLTVTPFMARDFESMTKTKVNIVTNGYDETDFEAAVPRRNEHFTIVHTGLLASDGNPLEFWRVLGEKCAAEPEFKADMRLRLIGKVDADVLESIRAAGLSDNLEQPGYMDHLETVSEQKGASMLLLPLRNDPDYRVIYPGKLFEYLASSAPVMGIGATDGAMAELLRTTGRGETFDWSDGAGMREFIDKVWAGSMDIHSRGVEAYSRANLTKQLAKLLDMLSE